ncbi:MAG: hypothetical protein AB7O96_14620 [Pseudobdellovibrionaceae bacterium]
MNIESRSYGGQIFRPAPVVYQDEKILIVATAWGRQEAAENTVQLMKDYLTAAQSDVEATTLYASLTCFSQGANSLRTAALLANETLYRTLNRKDYTTGVELFACMRTGSEVNWIQIGSPNAFLIRASQSPQQLTPHMDPSHDFGSDQFPPLPNQMLGLDSSCNLIVSGFRCSPGDQLVLVSRSHVPQDFFALKSYDLSEVSLFFARENAENPFWVGTVSIEGIPSEANKVA